MTLQYDLTDNNWFYYTLNDKKWGQRVCMEDSFRVGFDFSSVEIPERLQPFHIEMQRAADKVVQNAIHKHKSHGITVFYSGGIDSEIVLRCLKKSCKAFRVPLRAVTLEFPRGLNGDDVATAVETCKQLKVHHEVILHDVEAFATDPVTETMSQQCVCSQIAYMSVLRYVLWFSEDTVCLGGEILFQKHWSKGKPNWYFVYREDEDAMTYRFSMYHGIPVINEFMTYTPGLFYSWFTHPMTQNLFGEGGKYKLSMMSSKNAIFEECFFKPLGIEPSAKIKRHGYEQLIALNETTQARFRDGLPTMQEARVPIQHIAEINPWDSSLNSE